MTSKQYKPYRKAWRKALAALGLADRGGWMQDLVLYYDLQWNVATGEVGPVRYFVSIPRESRRCPLSGQLTAYDCRELSVPSGLTVPRVEKLLEGVGFRFLYRAPAKAGEFAYRTEDLSPKQCKAFAKAVAKFGYADRTARCGRLRLVLHDPGRSRRAKPSPVGKPVWSEAAGKMITTYDEEQLVLPGMPPPPPPPPEVIEVPMVELDA